MENIIQTLQSSVLCKNMSEDQIKNFIKTSSIIKKQYKKGSIIFQEYDTPTKLYLLMEGKISICKNTMSGRKILVTDIVDRGDMFGEIYLYMKKEQYGIYAMVQENAQVLEIDSNLFVMEDGKIDPSHFVVLQNILMIFAQKAFNMNMKLQVLSSGNIRECLARFILNLQQKEKEIILDMTREAMADYLNVARQSLSRELSAMQADGLIKVNGKKIIILEQERLEEYI